MNTVSIYLAIGVISGLAIAMNLIFFYNRRERGLSRLAGIAFALVIAGIFLGGVRVIGYGLLGVGVILSIIDMIQGSRHEFNT